MVPVKTVMVYNFWEAAKYLPPRGTPYGAPFRQFVIDFADMCRTQNVKARMQASRLTSWLY